MWISRLIGIAPLGIGLSVWGFLWFSPWNEFHSPPLFFRIFGSFVALPFVLIGVAAVFGRFGSSPLELASEAKERLKTSPLNQDSTRSAPPSPGKLKCPNCGSSPGSAEVSPHGDVKCDHCNRWYNVHTA